VVRGCKRGGTALMAVKKAEEMNKISIEFGLESP